MARLSIDLTDDADIELSRLSSVTELSRPSIFRHALSLFRIYVEYTGKGDKILIRHADGTESFVALPFSVEAHNGK